MRLSSGLKRKPSKKPTSSGKQIYSLLHADLILGLFLNTEDESDMFSEKSVDFQLLVLRYVPTRHICSQSRLLGYHVVQRIQGFLLECKEQLLG